MKAKYIEEILVNGGRLVLKDGMLGERYFIENDDSHEQPINKSQFNKFKESCNKKDESQQRWFRTDTSTWYYWRED